jgi:hypothetical protein
MGDPIRLLSPDSGARPAVREPLESLRDVSPPPNAKDKAWEGIAALTVAMTGTALSTTVAASSIAVGARPGGLLALASRMTISKLAATMVVIGTSAGAARLVVAHHRRTEIVRAETTTTAQSAQSKMEPPRVTIPSETVALPEAAPVQRFVKRPAMPSLKPSPRPSEQPPDPLGPEGALLTQARAELRQGNPVGAQALLDQLRLQFSNGGLSQERDVLAIEVLFALGNVEDAKSRARAFVEQHPRSPHSPHLQRLLDQAP